MFLYKYALVFLHNNLWLVEHAIQTPYQDSSRLIAQWKNYVLPILSNGLVKSVFSGDGGIKTAGKYNLINGTPHFLTGWFMNRADLPTELLKIDLKE